MKNQFLLILGLWFITTNCYSYKNGNLEANTQIENTKTYELRLNNKTKIIVKNIRVENDYYFYKDRKNMEKSIPKNSVLEMKERKFSWLKTSGVVVGTTALIIGVTIYSLNNMKLFNDINPDFID